MEDMKLNNEMNPEEIKDAVEVETAVETTVKDVTDSEAKADESGLLADTSQEDLDYTESAEEVNETDDVEKSADESADKSADEPEEEIEDESEDESEDETGLVVSEKSKIKEVLHALKEPAAIAAGAIATIAVLCITSKLGEKAGKGLLKSMKKKN